MRIYPKLFTNWIVVSKTLNDRYGIDGKVIGNGVEEKMFEALPKRGDYIAYMGRFDLVKKGLDILIEAVRILSEEGWLKRNNVRMRMAGEGQDRGKLLEMISENGLTDSVEVVGWVEGREKIQFVENAEFLVMPSRFEGQPIVSLEAGACYKPLIVSDIPELSHVVENGYGVSFKKFSPYELGEKIRSLHEQMETRQEMGQRGRKFAESNTWDSVVRTYEDYLRIAIRNFR